jgi:hypothetical protein
MRVSRLDGDNDWTFGRGKANYLKASEAIQQNVYTRLRSFKRDWYPDVDAGIDWLKLLGTRGVRVETYRREVERVVQSTEGVARIDRIDVEFDRRNRRLSVTVYAQDVYNNLILIDGLNV